jgi:hypothetical protein
MDKCLILTMQVTEKILISLEAAFIVGYSLDISFRYAKLLIIPSPFP